MMYNSLQYGSWPNFIGFGLGAMIGIGLLASLLFLAILALKGYALWHAAKRNEPLWFVVLLVVNTMGILELVYLYFVAKLWNKDSNNINSTSNT